MKVERLPPIVSSLKPSNHPYLNGAVDAALRGGERERSRRHRGKIPDDIDGVYLRNTENQIHQPLGRFHPFDGDGMIHQIELPRRPRSYRNRFVRTRCFTAEQEAEAFAVGRPCRSGASVAASRLRRARFAEGQCEHRRCRACGKALSTFYQCGEGYRLDPETLEQHGVAPWVPLDGISAPRKVDERTGELMFFNYSKHAPYLHYGVVDRDNRLTTYMPIPLAGPRLPHDMAFTEHYSILNDLPVFWDGAAGAQHPRGAPARRPAVALCDRAAHGGEMRWFEAEPTYVLHWVNAYEDGDESCSTAISRKIPMPRRAATRCRATST
jgi:carotenoid cleavage dioxygenase-like enzyme